MVEPKLKIGAGMRVHAINMVRTTAHTHTIVWHVFYSPVPVHLHSILCCAGHKVLRHLRAPFLFGRGSVVWRLVDGHSQVLGLHLAHAYTGLYHVYGYAALELLELPCTLRGIHRQHTHIE